MARKPRDLIEKAALLSTDAMRRAVTVRHERRVPVDAIIRQRPTGLPPAPPIAALPSKRRVFISYARKDRAIAKALARCLELRGIDVWWDYRLYSGELFRPRILAELKAAAAVIVIWSDASAQSDFVLDEASRAKEMRKLLTTLAPGFSCADIPLGFGQSHAISVTDRTRILEALFEYGILDHAADRPFSRPKSLGLRIQSG